MVLSHATFHIFALQYAFFQQTLLRPLSKIITIIPRYDESYAKNGTRYLSETGREWEEFTEMKERRNRKAQSGNHAGVGLVALLLS
jgi:hypothetical protein